MAVVFLDKWTPEHVSSRSLWPPGQTELALKIKDGQEDDEVFSKALGTLLAIANAKAGSPVRRQLNTVETLEVNFDRSLDNSLDLLDLLALLMSRCPNLGCVRLPCAYAERLAPQLPDGVSALELCGPVNSALLAAVAAAAPQLARLSLAVPGGCSLTPLAAMAALTELHITFQKGASWDVGEFARGSPLLETLFVGCDDGCDVAELVIGPPDAEWPALRSVVLVFERVDPLLVSALQLHNAPSLASVITTTFPDPEFQIRAYGNRKEGRRMWYLNLSGAPRRAETDYVRKAAEDIAACPAIRDGIATLHLFVDRSAVASLAPLAAVKDVSVTLDDVVDATVLDALTALPGLVWLRLGPKAAVLKGVAISALMRCVDKGTLSKLRGLWLYASDADAEKEEEEEARADHVAEMALVGLLATTQLDTVRVETLDVVLENWRNAGGRVDELWARISAGAPPGFVRLRLTETV